MSKFLLILFVVAYCALAQIAHGEDVSAMPTGKVQTEQAEQIKTMPHAVYASAFLIDPKAPVIHASAFIYDPHAAPIYASAFIPE